MDKTKDLIARITIDPKVMVGQPVVKGTRLTVNHILGLLVEGIGTKEILADYNNLTEEDIRACIAFAKAALEDTTFMPLTSAQ